MKKTLFAACISLTALLALPSCGGKQGPPAEKRQALARLSDTLYPAYDKLRDFQVMQMKAVKAADSWTINASETESKPLLRAITSKEYPELKKELNALSAGWPVSRKNALAALFQTEDSCMLTFTDIMAALPDSVSYDDADMRFQVRLVMADDKSEQNQRFKRAATMCEKLLLELQTEVETTFGELQPKNKPE